MAINDLLLYLALLGYLVGGAHYVLDVSSTRLRVGVVATWATLAGFGLHSVALALTAARLPRWGPAESLSLFAWGTVLIYLIVERRYGNRVMGALVMPLAILAAAAAAAAPERLHALAPGLRGWGPVVHVSLAILGNAAFVVTCCAGLMYLVQERQLKARHFGKMRFRLPALEQLDDMGLKSMLLGFPLLTLALLSGFLWAEQARGSFFQLRPRETWSLVSWLIYAGILYARVSAGWRGRKAAVLAILGFCLVLFTFLGVKILKSGAGSW
jgi:cytochrome c-type biogenesis protein CcsB